MSILAFNRIEKKYVINKNQYDLLLEGINDYMSLDKYCKNYNTYKIENIYYDTNNNELISKSIEKPAYKEKVRLRKYYGDNHYFLEVKKKGHGVVGKRRLELSLDDINNISNVEVNDYCSMLAKKELMYIFERYDLIPKVYLSYDRLGFFSNIDSNLRLTLDNNIITRRNDLTFGNIYGYNLLDDDCYILEIKSTNNFPFWLTRLINKLDIKPSSFSKYGEEYKKYLGGMYV